MLPRLPCTDSGRASTDIHAELAALHPVVFQIPDHGMSLDSTALMPSSIRWTSLDSSLPYLVFPRMFVLCASDSAKILRDSNNRFDI